MAQHPYQDGVAKMGLANPPTSVIPQGVGAPPPPGMDPKRGKLMCIKVRMLDDSVGVFHLGHKALGQALFDEVCRHLNLLECDYFGLEFLDGFGSHCWLDKEKPILRQITSSQSDARFYFSVKFYSPNPADLVEEYSRYLFALQIKRDLASGRFVCNDNTAALMVSYIVQSECGDFSPEDYPDHSYLSTVRFVPNQTPDFEQKVMDNHRKLVGTSPAEADLSLLETARRCDFYGVKFHVAKDIEGTPVNLCVLHLGIRVFHQLTCASTFSWAKVRKLSFKRKKFLVKLHPESYQYYKDTIEFLFETRNESKAFWKKCVENHAFFRCSEAERRKAIANASFLTKGSSFRYYGRTQKQLIDYVREHHKRREPFTRPIHSSFARGSRTPGSTVPRPIAAGFSSGSERSIPTPLLPVSSSKGQNGDVGQPQPGTPQLHRKGIGVTSKGVTVSPPAEASSPTPPPVLASKPPKCIGSSHSASASLDKKRTPRMYSIESSSSGAATVAGSQEHVQATPPFCRRQNGILSPASPGSHGAIGQVPEDSVVPASQSEKDIPFRFGTMTIDSGSSKRKKLPTVKSYFIARELLMTERTYNRDLNVISQHFKEAVSKMQLTDAKSLDDLFAALAPLADFHRGFLTELEQNLSSWEDEQSTETEPQTIGSSILCALHNSLQHYKHYISNLAIFLASIDQLYKTKKAFESACKEFQERKICYLPINQLLLKPVHRLTIWHQILTRLVSFYEEDGGRSSDLNDSRVAMEKIALVCSEMKSRVENLENFAKLVELERDLVGVDNLVQPNRLFLREGSLQRFSRKGPVQRIFVLLNDCLIYANRSGSSASGQHLSFKLHGQIPLRGLMLEDGDAFSITSGLQHCFTIYGANRSLIVSAGFGDEKRIWMEEISKAVMEAKECYNDTLPEVNALKTINSTEDVGSSAAGSREEMGCGASVLSSSSMHRSSPGVERQLQHKANDTLHVCWHRSSTLSKTDLHKAGRNLHSGYLVRKFRNSTGWQRLWVVYAHFCLFFFKTHTEESPLASLPLLGYQVGPPTAEDSINKEHVFKLYYKTHYYYFRADSDYSFNRWMEVIRSACGLSCPSSPSKTPVPVLLE